MNRILLRFKSWWLRDKHQGINRRWAHIASTMARANQVALSMQASQINTGHVLLGIAETTMLLQELGLDTETLEQAITEQSRTNFSEEDQGKKALESAIEEARLMQAPILEPQHLLAGLCRLEGTIAHKVLTDQHISVEKVRELRPET